MHTYTITIRKLCNIYFFNEQDHNYSIPSPDALKKKNIELQHRVEELERQLRNASLRESRAMKSLKDALEALKEKNLLTDELQSQLDVFSGLSPCLY